MPSEPEKPIEKLLRAAAQARRKQSGESWDVPSTSRRLWQREVTRRFNPDAGPRGSWLTWLLGHAWLKPAGALTGTVILLLVGWICFHGPASGKHAPLLASNQQPSGPAAPDSFQAPGEQPQRMVFKAENRAELSRRQLVEPNAMRDAEKTAALHETEAAKDLSAPSPTLSQSKPADGAQNSLAKNNLNRPATSADAPQFSPAPRFQNAGARAFAPNTATAPIAPFTAGPVLASAGRQAGNENGSPTGNAQALAASAADSAEFQTSNFATAQTLNPTVTNVVEYGYFSAVASSPPRNDEDGQQSRRDVTTRLRAAASVAPNANQGVLASFRMEQAGREMRVIDSDGSVYAGAIQAETIPAPAQQPVRLSDSLVTNGAQSKTPVLNAGQQSSPGFSFKVIGTNRSSNQQVIFSGILAPNTNQVLLDSKVFQTSGRAGGTVQQLSPNSPAQNVHVHGTALVGTGPILLIEAHPTTPPAAAR